MTKDPAVCVGVSLYSEYNPWDKSKRDLDIKYEED